MLTLTSASVSILMPFLFVINADHSLPWPAFSRRSGLEGRGETKYEPILSSEERDPIAAAPTEAAPAAPAAPVSYGSLPF